MICDCAIQESISHYYYTVSGDLFVGLLCAIGTFMVLYKGYERKDQIAASMAGFCAFGVALFPTSNNIDKHCSNFDYPLNPERVFIHYFFAAALFSTLAYMCFFLFTKSDKSEKHRTKMKTIRNRTYRFFGTIILISMVAILLKEKWPWFSKKVAAWIQFTFWFEWFATYSFGIAWLIKGGIILKDKVPEIPDYVN